MHCTQYTPIKVGKMVIHSMLYQSSLTYKKIHIAKGTKTYAGTHVHTICQDINSGLYMLYGASPDMQVSDSNTIPQVLQL